MNPQSTYVVVSVVLVSFISATYVSNAEELDLQLRYQVETGLGSGRFHKQNRDESWVAQRTAIVVCDVWDLHHCLNAVRRVKQLAPRLDAVLKEARSRGVTIIHAPSDCMDAYQDHPARKRAVTAPQAANRPHEIDMWCSVVPSEQGAAYPIDQSDGGEDDDPHEHAEWVETLKALGRNPGTPWKTQAELIQIDGDRDYISDRGGEIWNILQSRGIRNVILTGVHTNMCVLGRPFGLRQMVRNGKNVVLMRDLTDTMYNPKRWPYVSHFTGTDLIIDHIERFVCPTISSDQFVGGEPLRFQNDGRAHLVMLIAESLYNTEETLTRYAHQHLGRQFRVTTIYGDQRTPGELSGLSAVADADVLLVSVRRKVLPNEDMEIIRQHVTLGKPVIGIRTASHAFAPHNDLPPKGYSDWPEFDVDAFGGDYHGHHANDLESTVQAVRGVLNHSILSGMTTEPFPQGGSLYKTSPLSPGTTVLLKGAAPGRPEQPVAWTFTRTDGGRSFYTSLGNIDDFANPEFTRLLTNAIHWAVGRVPFDEHAESLANDEAWTSVTIPWNDEDRDSQHPVNWFRCVARVPAGWLTAGTDLSLAVPVKKSVNVQAWLNGTIFQGGSASTMMTIAANVVVPDDANLLVVRLESQGVEAVLRSAPVLAVGDAKSKLTLQGRWQFRAGDDPTWSNIPLPAKFGASPDIVFSPREPLFVSRPLTRTGEFTSGIEGPACDSQGNVFAVNYARQGTIGRVTPSGRADVFVQLPSGSVGNGIRFDQSGSFFVADYPKHNVLQIDLASREITVLAHNAQMNQPNDLAIAPDGTLYASDPNWGQSTGQLWRIDRDGTTCRLADHMGTTNGIEVSPDGKVLYVNESVQRNVWAFDISQNRTINNKRLVRRFADYGFDGMRCDVDGNLYVTRHGKGTVAKLSPEGDILREIDVLGRSPTNLCFGGPDGCTVYVTEVEFKRLVQFRVDQPGAAWMRWQERGD